MLTDVRMFLVLLAAASASGCGVTYVAQAARGQWQVMAGREPIVRLIDDPRTATDLRERLANVRAAREFAARELALPDNKSYTTYKDLEREFVVWSVVATDEFGVEPKEWCFPIVGCVAYRGYFSEKRAEAFAARLAARGHDVIVDGVPAYSTLGKLADPVLNTMMVYGDDELAALVFHELSHQVIYVAGDTAFNEAFAVTVEQEGLTRWLAHRGRASELAKYQQRRERQAAATRLVAAARAQLAELYASAQPAEEKRRLKARRFAALQSELVALETRFQTKSSLAAELAKGPNNARLASLATYFDCVPGFQRLLEAVGRDLPRFYATVREWAGRSREERRANLCSDLTPDISATGR
jgi:predicted aminopeptidase